MFGKRKKIETKAGDKKPRARKNSFVGKFLLFSILIGLCLGGGFMHFFSQIPMQEPMRKPDADGVVVLTGDAGRIHKAVWLISTTPAAKLLISGVNTATKTGEINELKNISSNFITCCIELDYKAKNTIDNAYQTHLWAKKHKMKSVVLVTSNYHIPRSLREMKLASPDINFIPYPVIDKKIHIKDWWEYPGSRRLLIREYFKYILALGRIGLTRIGVKSSILRTEPSQN